MVYGSVGMTAGQASKDFINYNAPAPTAGGIYLRAPRVASRSELFLCIFLALPHHCQHTCFAHPNFSPARCMALILTPPPHICMHRMITITAPRCLPFIHTICKVMGPNAPRHYATTLTVHVPYPHSFFTMMLHASCPS